MLHRVNIILIRKERHVGLRSETETKYSNRNSQFKLATKAVSDQNFGKNFDVSGRRLSERIVLYMYMQILTSILVTCANLNAVVV